MANPLADAIRRIVGYDPNKSQLGPDKFRGPLQGTTGIGYMQADKASAGSKSGGPGTTLGNTAPEDGMVKNSETKKPAAETGGNKVDATDPSKAIYGPNDGVYDPVDFLNTEDTLTTLKDAEDLLTGVGNLTSAAQGGGTLNGMNGITDCSTGKAINVRFDGFFVPPPGWENAETPPGDGPADHWELGISWFSPGFPSGYTANNPLAAATQSKNVVFPEYSVLVDTVFDPAFPHAGGMRRYIYTWEKPLDPTHDQVSFYAQDQACSPSPGDDICPTENPASPQYWPVDGELQLKRLPDGRLVPSDFEPPEDRIPEYMDGNRTTLNFCFSGGSRQGRVEATNDGGYMIYEKIAGVGTGIYKRFGPDNKIKGYSDAAGAQEYRILPREPLP